MPKRANINRIKAFNPYTLQEAADITGVSIHTIQNWAKDGLRVMDVGRPPLIRGDDLSDFIKRQRSKRKVKMAQDQFYCVCCKKAREAAGNMADCVIKGNRASLIALCSTCETPISRPISKAKIADIGMTLDLTITRHE